MPTPSIHAFAEKVVVITDAGNAVGRAVALQLALQGAYVVCGFEDDAQASTFDELKDLGTLAEAVKFDRKSAENVQIVINEAASRYGRIDYLVNSLKISGDCAFSSITDAEISAVFSEFAESVMFGTHAAFDLMNARPKPRIVNVFWTSGGGFFEACAAGFIEKLTKKLSEELPKKFRVNAVEITEESERKANELFAETSGVKPDDAARAVVYLLSNEAVAVNGSTIQLR